MRFLAIENYLITVNIDIKKIVAQGGCDQKLSELIVNISFIYRDYTYNYICNKTFFVVEIHFSKRT